MHAVQQAQVTPNTFWSPHCTPEPSAPHTSLATAWYVHIAAAQLHSPATLPLALAAAS